MALLELQGITAGYDKNMILRDFHLSVSRGDFVSLLGSSGCGKTTTLRLIAGFNAPVSGSILFDGRDITNVPLHRRNFGFVFQSYALFPHMTVFDNVAFGLKMRKTDRRETEKRVMEMLELVDLKGFERRYPREMSGGQRQRVALARAMVIRPELMLFDEPLSNLDAKLRVKMRVEIRRIQQELGFTAIYVTHDQEECFAISDQVAIMNGGVIEQMDTPAHIYTRPRTEFIARFVGFENFLNLQRRGGVLLLENGQPLSVPEAPGTGDTFKACIRPEDIQIAPEGESLENPLQGEVMVTTFLGRNVQYNVSTPLGEIVCSSAQEHVYSIGSRVTLGLSGNKIILIEARPNS
ncbi:MAG: ABC transporter ATP-binding protein [Clostridia bacterium]|nr:ABC transporter ATP-binding protein [Clostridia bacterium]